MKEKTAEEIKIKLKDIAKLQHLYIEIFTDEGDVVIDPVAGSASTLRACAEMNRSCYGFEIKKDFYNKAKELMISDEILDEIFDKSQITIEELMEV